MILQSVGAIGSPENFVVGVAVKELKSWPDERGFFREVIRFNDPIFELPTPRTHASASETNRDSFGQWSHSKMGINTVKAWHYHHRQTDWWYCAMGAIHVALFDLREESPTHGRKVEFFLGEPELSSKINHPVLSGVVRIPPGVAHGLKVLTDEAHLLYITSETYDPQDEGRYPFHCESIPHRWAVDESELIVVSKDRVQFTPAYDRAPIG